ncbi:MAG: SIMPL domain-containing protein [Thermomicrobiales bacterium]
MEREQRRFSPHRAVRKIHVQLALVLGVILALIATPMVLAQTPVNSDGTEVIRTISVSGTGIVSVEPDTADVTFAVQSDNVSLKDAQADSTTRLQGITDALIAGGVAEEDVVTSSYYVTVMNEYDDDGNFERINGYRVDAQITATVRDIDALGGLLDTVVTAGANGIYGMYFYVSDPGPAATQARASAMTDARTKADELAELAGVNIIGVVSISESWAPLPEAQRFDIDQGGAADSMSAEALPVPISPGSTDLSVEIQVIFEIEQING